MTLATTPPPAAERIELGSEWTIEPCCPNGWVIFDPSGEAQDHIPDEVARAFAAAMTTPPQGRPSREAVAIAMFEADAPHLKGLWKQEPSQQRATYFKFADAALALLPSSPQGRPSLPTQQEMNQTFYVDVCRAEDRLKEFVAATDKLLLSLPDHWHDDATVELRDLASDTDAILNPHMHSAYEVEQAAKRYGAGSVVPPQSNKEPQP